MKKLLFILLLSVYFPSAQLLPTNGQDEVRDHVDTSVATHGVDVQALDDLIDTPDFPEPDPAQLHIPTWKIWLIKAADTMIWTVQTGKKAIMTAYDRCKRLVIPAEDEDEIKS